MTAAASTFLVVEDGREYTERFARLLGARFRFTRAGSAEEAAALACGGAVGLLLDLDFGRTAPDQLIDDNGRAAGAHPDGERRRLAAVQGILILRALRRAGVTLPALLFADLDDAEQIAFLQSDLHPLRVVASSAGLQEIARLLDRLAAGQPL
ncbi:MAG TPA: hypothetical protein VH374_07635 [Polyangia bacterium]|jgi:hypothetical protein|nr:hypothetical protein [Polyangia bacterium]